VVWAIAADRPDLEFDALTSLWYARIHLANIVSEHDELVNEEYASLERAGQPIALQTQFELYRGVWETMRGNYPAAMERMKASLELARVAGGEDSHSYSSTLVGLGWTADLMGQPALAETYYRQSLEIRNKLFPKGHPERNLALLRIADEAQKAGRPQEAAIGALVGWRECLDSGMPEANCRLIARTLVSAKLVQGEYACATDLLISLEQLEREIDRPLMNSDTPDPLRLSEALALRGELEPGESMERAVMATLMAMQHPGPAGLLHALIRTVEGALHRSDPSLAKHSLMKIQELLSDTGAPIEQMGIEFDGWLSTKWGSLALLQGRPQEAIDSFEAAMVQVERIGGAATNRSTAHLDLTRALLALGVLEAADEHAQLGLELRNGVDGLARHLAVPYHEVLAQIALAQERYGDVLAQCDHARAAFDPVEVLDNRLAPFTFLEARAWKALDPSPSGRRYADKLAQRALREYQDWDAGAGKAISEVRTWLRHQKR
jgi:tetratricopeptide (TPR) repeat protein